MRAIIYCIVTLSIVAGVCWSSGSNEITPTVDPNTAYVTLAQCKELIAAAEQRWVQILKKRNADLTNLAQSHVQPVWRFWSPELESHVFIVDPNERAKLINEYAHVWTDEGEVFKVLR